MMMVSCKKCTAGKFLARQSRVNSSLELRIGFARHFASSPFFLQPSFERKGIPSRKAATLTV